MFCCKSTSRTVHHCREEEKEHKQYQISSDEETSTSFTVWRKSLIFNCNGFTVIGSDGSLVYRVDNYTGRPGRVILMDGAGNPIFTICRPKKLSLVKNYWLVYEGEVDKHSMNSHKKPVFCVRKSMNIMKGNKSVLAYVYGGTLSDRCKRCTYMVEGSYRNRSCKILDESRRVMGEIKMKETMTGGVSFGLDVFRLTVKDGFESRFGMAIVLLLDQMFS